MTEARQLCSGAEPVAGNYFVSNYPPFSVWTAEAVTAYEDALAQPASDAPELGVYLHTPFCVDRCHYCYYLSHDDRLAEMDRHLDAVGVELGMLAERPRIRGRKPGFVYFGGGTPSLLSLPRLERLFASLGAALPLDAAREVSFECAPRSVTPAKLEFLRAAGVTRLSLGVQQMNDEILAANGRVHLVEDVERAYAAVRAVGFDVVNLDLIVGLVGETAATFQRSFDRVLALQPDSITIYQLEVPLNTPLWRKLREDALEPGALPSWATKRQRLRDAREQMVAAGFQLTSAYAGVRDPSRHRFVYQQSQYHGADLLGVGASAFSHVAGCNHQNRPALQDYLEAVGKGELPSYRAYALSARERAVREFVLQLKLGGVDAAALEAKFGLAVRELFAEPLAECAAAGWLAAEDGRITVTNEGALRIDRLLPKFYLAEHRDVRYS